MSDQNEIILVREKSSDPYVTLCHQTIDDLRKQVERLKEEMKQREIEVAESLAAAGRVCIEKDEALAAAKEDAARLDWLDKMTSEAILFIQTGRGADYWDFVLRVCRNGDIYFCEGNPRGTARAALDATRNKSK